MHGQLAVDTGREAPVALFPASGTPVSSQCDCFQRFIRPNSLRGGPVFFQPLPQSPLYHFHLAQIQTIAIKSDHPLIVRPISRYNASQIIPASSSLRPTINPDGRRRQSLSPVPFAPQWKLLILVTTHLTNLLLFKRTPPLSFISESAPGT